MSYIRGKHGYARCLVAFVIVSALISTVLIMAGWTTTYALTRYSAHFIVNAKSEIIGGSASHGGAVPFNSVKFRK